MPERIQAVEQRAQAAGRTDVLEQQKSPPGRQHASALAQGGGEIVDRAEDQSEHDGVEYAIAQGKAVGSHPGEWNGPPEAFGSSSCVFQHPLAQVHSNDLEPRWVKG